jgi:type III secretion system YscJ/HrcJ family lipoprotein
MSQRGNAGATSRRILAGIALVALATGCTVPIAVGLDESDANRAIVALEKNGVAADKERDPDSEGHWRVSVARDDASSAAVVLSSESLPPPASPGVLDTLGQGSIVPSRSSEQAKFVTGVAGDLERSLRSLDGVVSVRVHLAVPVQDSLAPDEAPVSPSASVLLRHRGAAPPISNGDVQRLVAGAVPGLVPAQVTVVALTVPTPTRPAERELSRFGPVTVTRSSVFPLRSIVGGALFLNLGLLGALILVWARARRAESGLAEQRAAETQGAR